MKCTHYNRNCVINSPCCQKIYPCRLCHDEQSDHEINRKLINTIICDLCKTEQKCSNECEHCHIQFGDYYCQICHLWSSDKDIYHCNQCEICRIGPQELFFHCLTCRMCLSVAVKDNHTPRTCIEDVANSDCACCKENLFSSVQALSVLKCNHIMHTTCMNEYLNHNNYNCPLCKKSMHDLTSLWRKIDVFLLEQEMPEEFKDKKSDILCNDCQKYNQVDFHFIYHKCLDCGSYNTTLI